jgi:hypothetical protein
VRNGIAAATADAETFGILAPYASTGRYRKHEVDCRQALLIGLTLMAVIENLQCSTGRPKEWKNSGRSGCYEVPRNRTEPAIKDSGPDGGRRDEAPVASITCAHACSCEHRLSRRRIPPRHHENENVECRAVSARHKQARLFVTCVGAMIR